MKIPFCLPYIDKDIHSEIDSCLNITGWLTTGPKVLEFENEITKLCKTNSTICVNSWTSGLQLLIRWLDYDKDDEIIVPTYTYAASALAIINSNVKCVFVDVNSDFTIDINKVENAITEKTKAILPVDIGGLPADYIKLNNLLKSDKIKRKFKPKTKFQQLIGRPLIISDAAHSIGSQINNIPTSLYSDFTIFPFHSVKNITTGEGGCVVTNDRKVINFVNKARLLGVNNETKLKLQNKRNNIPTVDVQGWRYHMSNINAAIGMEQLKRFDILKSKRQQKFYYSEITN